MSAPRAVVLLSGGLDSATALAMARDEGFDCYALSFDYGQRHRCELEAAASLARQIGAVEHRTLRLDLGQLGGSALTDPAIDVPEGGGTGIPTTYVPARNTVFLSMALAWAEVLGAWDLVIGANAVDYSGYPDCRPAFIEAFEAMANQALKATVEGSGRIRVRAPLMALSKGAIIAEGSRLGVDYRLTVSCYDPDERGRACGRCDSCRLRARGFVEAGVADPTIYRPE
ncbi:MAG: 7-cyano-7-deazaguanine synthase QueC [Pseudomonadota bacterium]